MFVILFNNFEKFRRKNSFVPDNLFNGMFDFNGIQVFRNNAVEFSDEKLYLNFLQAVLEEIA